MTPAPDRGLRTVALIKQVPLGGGNGLLGADGRLDRGSHDAEMNPWCRRAVAQAVRLGQGPGGRSTVVTMGPPAAAAVLREALACGVDDAVHVSDRRLAGADCLATSRMLAAAVAGLGEVDLVLAGRSSLDGGTSAVGPMVAEVLGLPFAGPVLSAEVERDDGGAVLRATVQSEDGTEPAAIRLPAVVSVAERSCRPAKAPAESWPDGSAIRTLTVRDLTGGEVPVSPTEVIDVFETAQDRRPAVLAGEDIDGLVRRAVDLWWQRESARGRRVPERRAVPAGPGVAPVTAVSAARDIVVLAGLPDCARALIGEAAALAARVGGRVLAVVPADPDLTRLASWGADEVLVLGAGAPRPVAAALASWIEGHAMPWAILGSARSWDREVLGRLAVRLGAGLMSDLVRLYARAEGDGPARIVGAKPSGDTSVAEIVGHGPTQIATLRTGCLDLRAPRPGTLHLPIRFLHVSPEPAISVGPRRPDPDYDALERAEVVIGVGHGVDPARYDELLPLCARLGAELAATRKVTDAGRLPHSRQVGITARDIAPRLYIAVGLLGNRNHMAGVARAGTILAINADPAAPVFTQCDIGIVADWREAVPRLVAELERRGHTRAPARPSTTAGVTT